MSRLPAGIQPLRQSYFDPLGPTVHQASLATGRRVQYIDEGNPRWPVLLFLGGAGTSVRAFRLVEFARTLREELGIRVVSVERNGLGSTPFDPTVGYPQYAEDTWALLDRLDIRHVAVVAISGGGPYAAHVMVRRPSAVRSVHLACAFSEPAVHSAAALDAEEIHRDPVAWWRFPPESPIRHIPGFADSCVEEATRSMFARGRDTGPDGLRQALDLYATQRLPVLSAVTAPAFLYWGTEDDLVPTAHLRRWREVLPNIVRTREYAGEGHDVQYRHWDQILCDVVHRGTKLIMTDGRCSALVDETVAPHMEKDGWGLGIAAWATPGGPQPTPPRARLAADGAVDVTGPDRT